MINDPEIIFFCNTLEKFYCRPKIWTNILRWISVRNSSGRNFGENFQTTIAFLILRITKIYFFSKTLYHVLEFQFLTFFKYSFILFFFSFLKSSFFGHFLLSSQILDQNVDQNFYVGFQSGIEMVEISGKVLGRQ